MRAVWVTGGAGFIGSCMVRRLIREKACQVIVLGKLTYAGRLENLAEVEDSELLHFQRGDIGDKALVRYLLPTYSPDWVINLAAESHVDRSIDHPSVFVDRVSGQRSYSVKPFRRRNAAATVAGALRFSETS